MNPTVVIEVATTATPMPTPVSTPGPASVSTPTAPAPTEPTPLAVVPPTPTPDVVYVSPGDDLRQLVNDNDEGTTFYLRAGVHVGARAFPKNDQKFIGEPGAILDGDGVGAPAFIGTRAEGSDRVVIRGLEIRNYQPGRNDGAISARPLGEAELEANLEGRDWVISENAIHGNGGAGINVGSGMVVEDNYIYNNRQIGISGLGSGDRPLVGMTITNNTIEGNNAEPFDFFEYHEGGIKLNGATDTEITKNWISRNWGFGLHCDRQCDNVVIEGNVVRDALAHPGRDSGRAFAAEIYIELSTDVTVRGNEVVVEDSIPAGERDKAIRINESQNIVVEDNTLRLADADAEHIMSLGFNSCCDRPPTSDTTFRNNTVEARAGTIFVGSRDVDVDGGNIKFEDNSYVELGGSFVFKHRSQSLTFEQWKALGFDTGSSLGSPD